MGRPKKPKPPPVTMTGPEIRAARETLGQMWGMGEPVTPTQLATLLRVHPGTVLQAEAGKHTPTGPFFVAIRMMLAGAYPPDLLKILRL